MALEVVATAKEINSWLGSRLEADRGQSSEPIHIRVENSPEVSATTIAEAPDSIWRSQSFANAIKSILSESSNGVGRSGRYPVSQVAGVVRCVISRGVFHLTEVLAIGRQDESLLAPDACLDPKAHLLQPGSNFQTKPALAGIDQDGNRCAGAEELRYLRESMLYVVKGVFTRDQADGVLALRIPAGRGGRHADEAAPPERKMKFEATAAGDDGAMQVGQAGEPDHGIEDFLLL
jgi:hypothetical protein